MGRTFRLRGHQRPYEVSRRQATLKSLGHLRLGKESSAVGGNQGTEKTECQSKQEGRGPTGGRRYVLALDLFCYLTYIIVRTSYPSLAHIGPVRGGTLEQRCKSPCKFSNQAIVVRLC
jgi:hypothetical protein